MLAATEWLAAPAFRDAKLERRERSKEEAIVAEETEERQETELSNRGRTKRNVRQERPREERISIR